MSHRKTQTKVQFETQIMSIKVMTAVFETDLPPTEKIVALKLADHAWDDGTHVYPSAASVAIKCSMSERQVWRILKILLEKGIIVLEKSGGGRNSNLYHFPLDSHGKITPSSTDNLTYLNVSSTDMYVIAPMTPEVRSTDTDVIGIIRNVIEPSPEKKKNDYPPLFEEFWKPYPRKKEKDGAFTVWERLVNKKDVDPHDLIASSTAYGAECERKSTEQQFIKLAATFLGPKGSWKDYLPESFSPALLEQAAAWDEYDQGTSPEPDFSRPTDAEGNLLDGSGRAYYIDEHTFKRRYLDTE